MLNVTHLLQFSVIYFASIWDVMFVYVTFYDGVQTKKNHLHKYLKC